MDYLSQSETTADVAELAGTIAHELNNIFTAVSGNLSLLSEELRVMGPPAETIDEIVRTAQRGIALSERLQAFAGRQPLKRRPVDIGRILAEGVEEVRTAFPALDVTISLPCKPMMVFTDEAKMRAALRDLAANAAAAMDGRGLLRLRATPKFVIRDNRHGLRPGSYVAVEVADNGHGMDSETARRAAVPAFSTRSSNINAGWGLSSCVGFIRQCGGVTQLSTAPGHGTIVQMFLPLEAANDSASADPSSELIIAPQHTHFSESVRPFVFFY